MNIARREGGREEEEEKASRVQHLLESSLDVTSLESCRENW